MAGETTSASVLTCRAFVWTVAGHNTKKEEGAGFSERGRPAKEDVAHSGSGTNTRYTPPHEQLTTISYLLPLDYQKWAAGIAFHSFLANWYSLPSPPQSSSLSHTVEIHFNVALAFEVITNLSQ